MPSGALTAMSTAYTSTDFGIAGAWLAEYTLDALGAGVVVFDSFGHMMQWNDRAPSVLGLEPESMSGRSLGDLGWNVTDANGVRIPAGRCPVTDVLRTGESIATMIHVPQPDGTRRAIGMRILPVFSHAGYTRGALASLVPHDDIEPVGPYQSQSGDSWASFEYSLLARLVVDPIGRLLDWNRQLLALTGYDDLSVADRRFEQICNLDLAWMWSSLEVANGEPMEGWISIRPADGGPLVPVVRGGPHGRRRRSGAGQGPAMRVTAPPGRVRMVLAGCALVRTSSEPSRTTSISLGGVQALRSSSTAFRRWSKNVRQKNPF